MCPYCPCHVGICDELQSRESEMGRKWLLSLISSGIVIVLFFPTVTLALFCILCSTLADTM